MALTDILRGRAARKGAAAQVDCGELGLLTVEALSPADCIRLAEDSRALLYAACRELQTAGEELRSEGKIFRPDEILAYVTDEEADAAVQTILALIGLLSADGPVSEIRHQSVQTPETDFSEIRHQSVQPPAATLDAETSLWADDETIRHLPVQDLTGAVAENGQVSREFGAETTASVTVTGTDKKSQILGELSSRTAQILVSENGQTHESGFLAGGATAALHEIESESGRQRKEDLHETESELRSSRLRKLHETTSDFGSGRGILLHETESESASAMHEIKSELQKAVHEIKSEVRQMLHEIESELPEAAAQRLAEALLRAGNAR